MKKLLLGIAQILCFGIIYMIIANLLAVAIALITAIVQKYSIFRFQAILLIYETITQTILPVIAGIAISSLMLTIFRGKINIWSFVVVAVTYLYGAINNILMHIKEYGLLTMDTGVAVWISVLLGACALVPLFGATGYQITTQDQPITNE